MDDGSGGRPGPDQVAGPERRKGADVVDQPREAPGQPVGAVLLPQLAVHTRHQMQRLGRIELVGGHDPWPDAAGAVKILALGDVERTVPQPVAHAALVAAGHAAPLCRSPGSLLLRSRTSRRPSGAQWAARFRQWTWQTGRTGWGISGPRGYPCTPHCGRDN